MGDEAAYVTLTLDGHNWIRSFRSESPDDDETEFWRLKEDLERNVSTRYTWDQNGEHEIQVHDIVKGFPAQVGEGPEHPQWTLFDLSPIRTWTLEDPRSSIRGGTCRDL